MLLRGDTHPGGDVAPVVVAGLFLAAAYLLDANFAEAPGTDKSAGTQAREQETRERLKMYNSIVTLPLSPANSVKNGALNLGKKVLARQVKKNLKKIPNPFGKKGKPAHQEKVKEAEKDLKKEGYTKTETEVMVPTPKGEKSKRFVDVKGTNPETGESKMVQVGKTNKDGTPVKRERTAKADIEEATGEKVEFKSYNNDKKP